MRVNIYDKERKIDNFLTFLNMDESKPSNAGIVF